MNEHFVQSELEYRRQQRLASAAQFRRVRAAKRAGSFRAWVASVTRRGAHRATGSATLPRRGAGATHAA